MRLVAVAVDRITAARKTEENVWSRDPPSPGTIFVLAGTSADVQICIKEVPPENVVIPQRMCVIKIGLCFPMDPPQNGPSDLEPQVRRNYWMLGEVA